MVEIKDGQAANVENCLSYMSSKTIYRFGPNHGGSDEGCMRVGRLERWPFGLRDGGWTMMNGRLSIREYEGFNKIRMVLAGDGNMQEYRDMFPDMPEPPVEGMRRERCLLANRPLNQGISPEADPWKNSERLSDVEVMDIRTKYGMYWTYGTAQQGETGRVWWKETRNNTSWKYPHVEAPCQPLKEYSLQAQSGSTIRNSGNRRPHGWRKTY